MNTQNQKSERFALPPRKTDIAELLVFTEQLSKNAEALKEPLDKLKQRAGWLVMDTTKTRILVGKLKDGQASEAEIADLFERTKDLEALGNDMTLTIQLSLHLEIRRFERIMEKLQPLVSALRAEMLSNRAKGVVDVAQSVGEPGAAGESMEIGLSIKKTLVGVCEELRQLIQQIAVVSNVDPSVVAHEQQPAVSSEQPQS